MSDDDDLWDALQKIPPPDIIGRPEPSRETTDLLRGAQFQHVTVHLPREPEEGPDGTLRWSAPRTFPAVMATVLIHRDDETRTDDDDDTSKDETDDDDD